MSDLRNELTRLKTTHLAQRYPGDLAADINERAIPSQGSTTRSGHTGTTRFRPAVMGTLAVAAAIVFLAVMIHVAEQSSQPDHAEPDLTQAGTDQPSQNMTLSDLPALSLTAWLKLSVSSDLTISTQGLPALSLPTVTLDVNPSAAIGS
jgi:hypothetical protein